MGTSLYRKAGTTGLVKRLTSLTACATDCCTTPNLNCYNHTKNDIRRWYVDVPAMTENPTGGHFAAGCAGPGGVPAGSCADFAGLYEVSNPTLPTSSPGYDPSQDVEKSCLCAGDLLIATTNCCPNAQPPGFRVSVGVSSVDPAVGNPFLSACPTPSPGFSVWVYVRLIHVCRVAPPPAGSATPTGWAAHYKSAQINYVAGGQNRFPIIGPIHTVTKYSEQNLTFGGVIPGGVEEPCNWPATLTAQAF